MLAKSGCRLAGYTSIGWRWGFCLRHFGAKVKVGDKIPVAFIKDAPPPTIKPDSEYPEWVFALTERLASKSALLAKLEKGGAESMTDEQLMRVKRLITIETIKENNIAKGTR